MHAIGFAPQTALGGNFLNTAWEDVATAVQISTYSLKSLAVACLPLMKDGGVGRRPRLRRHQAWPVYDWMGVAKAGLESSARYLARYLGPRRHPRQPRRGGPAQDDGGQEHPGLRRVRARSGRARAPLGWDVTDPEPTAKACVALLSDWFPATTGEIVHVDGGVHAVGC